MGIQKYGDQIGWLTICPGDQIFGDHLSMGTEFDGDRLSRGIDFMGIICPGGQKVGHRKSRDQRGSGPNALQPPHYVHCTYFISKVNLAPLCKQARID